MISEWSPGTKDGPDLWWLAHREAKRRGVPYSRSIETDLQAEYDAWTDARKAVRDNHRVADLAQASDDAWHAAADARDRVLDHPAASAEVLTLKLYMLAERWGDEEGAIQLPTQGMTRLIADVARVIGH